MTQEEIKEMEELEPTYVKLARNYFRYWELFDKQKEELAREIEKSAKK